MEATAAFHAKAVGVLGIRIRSERGNGSRARAGNASGAQNHRGAAPANPRNEVSLRPTRMRRALRPMSIGV